MMKADKLINGPVPGENFLADKRNYPWHRPPEYTDLNEAMEFILERLTRKKTLVGIVQLLDIGLPITLISQMILTKGISSGRWTMDLALLLAGPLSHMLVIIARKQDIEVNLGIEDTSADLIPQMSAVRKLSEPLEVEQIQEEVKEDVIEPMGFADGVSKEQEKPAAPTGFGDLAGGM